MITQSPPESVCVVRLSAIGDTVHALAVVRALQDHWPETRITWIIGKTEASLLADIPGIEFIIFDKSAGLAAYRDVRTHLHGRSFDVALCMHASMRANRLYPLIRTPHRIGYDRARAKDFQWLFTNRRIPPRQHEHVLDAMMGFARLAGISPGTPRWDIPVSDRYREFAARFVTGNRPLLLISPCSSQRSRNFRNWDADNYAAAANYAVHKYNCRIVLTGGRSDVEQSYGRHIKRICGDSVDNLIGETSLKELQALIAAASGVLCPDSGPAHMATAAGTPVIGLYATSNPDRTGPYASRHLVVNAYPEAVSRYLGKSVAEVDWGERVRDPGAMALIRLAAVTEKIDAWFAGV
jgi:heptosyltransferase I